MPRTLSLTKSDLLPLHHILHMLASTGEVLRTPCFQIQLVLGLMTCWGANFGFAWATLSKWGKHGLVEVYITKTNSESMSLTSDFLITAFLVGWIAVALSTGGIKVQRHSWAVLRLQRPLRCLRTLVANTSRAMVVGVWSLPRLLSVTMWGACRQRLVVRTVEITRQHARHVFLLLADSGWRLHAAQLSGGSFR